MFEQKHIGFISHEHPLWGAGGAGRHVQVISKELVKMGHKVSVFGILPVKKNQLIIDEGVEIHALSPSSLPKFKFISHAIKLLKVIKKVAKSHPIDILEGADLNFAFIPKRLASKYVIHMHGSHLFFSQMEHRQPNIWRSLQEKISYAKADAFIAPTAYAGKETMKIHQRNYGYTVIPSALDWAWLSPLKKNQPKAGKFNNLLFVGTLCPKKGVDELLSAYSILQPKIPNLTLTLVGPDWQQEGIGSYKAYLKKKHAATIKQGVSFAGSYDLFALKNAYENSDICIFPSHAETFGIVAIEAMAMAKPVIFTRKAPGPEILHHGYTGLLCNPNNPEDIANKIADLIHNPHYAETLAKNAFNTVRTKYHPKRIAIATWHFYQQLLS